MRYKVAEDYRQSMMLICLFKVLHDAGITFFEDYCADSCVNEQDFYYEYVMEALQNAAPIVEQTDGLYQKYGYTEDDEVNIWAFSSKEIQEYYKIARKLHRLQGCPKKENMHIRKIEMKMESIRGFDSYNFDYGIGNKHKKARLELLWGFEFMDELVMCLWVVRVMELFKAELPLLKEKYRIARRLKRSQGKCKGGSRHASHR